MGVLSWQTCADVVVVEVVVDYAFLVDTRQDLHNFDEILTGSGVLTQPQVQQSNQLSTNVVRDGKIFFSVNCQESSVIQPNFFFRSFRKMMKT